MKVHFRHTYRTPIDDIGTPLAVQQRLMRHADIKTTMNTFGSAFGKTKRRANNRVATLVSPPAIERQIGARGLGSGCFFGKLEARNSRDPLICESGTTPAAPQICNWLRGVDLNPNRLLTARKLLILNVAKPAKTAPPAL